MELRRMQRVEGWQNMKQKREEEEEMKKREEKEQEALEEEFKQWQGEEDWPRAFEEGDQKREEKRRKKEDHKNTIVEPAYEKLQTEVKKYDDGLVGGWKEDIDTLLVFAGLFSAVVTAFLIESYQWLTEDTTVVLLSQISQQLNGKQTQLAPFTPEASSIRINCFWFLSLIFSLTSALFGLLCKQWLREHQRDVPTRTVAEGLALRQLRRDSFEKWGVASLLSALPILLEIALVFFFVSILDLLWMLHRIPFSICLVAIALSVGSYFLTTFLPTMAITRDQARFIHTQSLDGNSDHDFGQLTYQFICPYKSPQAWAVYKLFIALTKPLLRCPLINNFTKIHFRALWDHVQSQTPNWSTFDLRVVRQFDQVVDFVNAPHFQLKVYELRALQWAVTMFRDSPSMLPHLENVLKTFPPSVAISAILDRWDAAMWEVSNQDMGSYLRDPNLYQLWPKPITSDPPLFSQQGIELLFWHQVWDTCVKGVSYGWGGAFDELEEEIARSVPTLSKTQRFLIPVPLATTLWSHRQPWIRHQSLRLLQYFETSWKPFPGHDEEQHNKERVAFAMALQRYINDLSDQPSVLLTNRRGQEFMRLIHNDIIVRRLYSRERFRVLGWVNAVRKVQEVGYLPPDCFVPLPKKDEDPPPSVELPQLKPIRYSIDTYQAYLADTSRSNYPRNEVEERTPSPVYDVAENIDIQVHGGDSRNEVAVLADDTSLLSSVIQGGHADSGSQLVQDTDEGYPLPAELDAAWDVHSQSVASSVCGASNSSHEDHTRSGLVRHGTGGDSNQHTSNVGDSPLGLGRFTSTSRETVPGGINQDDSRLEAAEDTNEGFFSRAGAHEQLAGAGYDERPNMDDYPEDYTSPSGYRVNHVEQDAGGNGMSCRVGWNPTNDPNTLRVQWFRP
ncbi:hypothetical protein VNI00_004912 [Paramarasmius palmivorus]|uniref:DUF6535 domain-containing protein n=1 Tax=Paramarasmius palmivorus TaxID=297713 RepID=A0AAW0DJD5_9AGAR